MALTRKRVIRVLAFLAVPGLAAGWLLSAPRPLDASALPAHVADLANGKNLFNAAGCQSCHAPDPALATADAKLPSGGKAFKTPVGTLYPPNLTPDQETGLGRWTDIQFVNAVQRGISPAGTHYIPAFPYTSYAQMRVEDVLDIKAHLASLPAVSSPPKPAEIPLPFVLRRGLGLWKWIGLNEQQWTPDAAQSPEWNRGSYLVNGPGHCNECHTPRNIAMAMDTTKRFMGGPHPDGTGSVPSLRDLIGRQRYKNAADLTSAFINGEDFGYLDMSDGGMGEVRDNLAKLPEADVAAIAEYIASLK